MAMRLLKLPADLPPLVEVLGQCFQYPENEAWSVQDDEQEEIVDAMGNLRRIWPLIRAIQALSPALRDLLRGYVWEENGQLVGTTLVQRRGSTEAWYINTVGVLPTYRRRGIARTLVEAALDLIRSRGGRKALLSVIDGNRPAYALYEKLGFGQYDGTIEFQATPETAPPQPALPGQYTLAPLARFDWQPVYELARRTAQPSTAKYEPVEVGRFRPAPMMRLLWPLLSAAQGKRERRTVVRTGEAGRVVAWGECAVPTRGKGISVLAVHVDPAHPAPAPCLVNHLLRQAVTACPGHRVALSVSGRMQAVVAAAEEAGFARRMVYCRMGLEL